MKVSNVRQNLVPNAWHASRTESVFSWQLLVWSWRNRVCIDQIL